MHRCVSKVPQALLEAGLLQQLVSSSRAGTGYKFVLTHVIESYRAGRPPKGCHPCAIAEEEGRMRLYRPISLSLGMMLLA